MSGLGLVQAVAVDKLRTNLQGLRLSSPKCRTQLLSELPLRVMPLGDGSFEVIDGFKRLLRARERGAKTVLVVIERMASTAEAISMLLAANRPPRTLGAMDEARAVGRLADEKGVGSKTIAKLLGRTPCWVARRLNLAEHLAAPLQQKLD